MIGTDKLKVNHISARRGTTLLKNQYPKQAKSIAYAPQPAPNCRRSVKELLDEHDRTFGKPEDGLTKWRREAREQEERFAREREKSRNLTDSEMARWRTYFEGLVAGEHTAVDERIREEREFTRDLMAQVVAELRESIEADTHQALEGVRKQGEERLAEVRGVVDRLRSDLLALGAQQEDVCARMADVAQSIVDLPAEGPPGPAAPAWPTGPLSGDPDLVAGCSLLPWRRRDPRGWNLAGAQGHREGTAAS